MHSRYLSYQFRRCGDGAVAAAVVAVVGGGAAAVVVVGIKDDINDIFDVDDLIIISCFIDGIGAGAIIVDIAIIAINIIADVIIGSDIT